MFYGEPGSKKTYSLLSMAVCVALGKSWLDFMVSPRTVLFVDEESGERRFTMRLAAAIRGEFGNEDIPLKFVNYPGFKLDSKDDPAELERLITDTGAGLVIIDALADVMDGDENSKKDTQPVFTALRKIADHTDAAIIVIHHSNKSGGYRGSSAIKGALDLMVKIESEEGSHTIIFKTEKSRDTAASKFAATATWSDDLFYLVSADVLDKPSRLSKSQKYVLRYLEEHGSTPLPEIMGAADACSPNAAKQAVYSLVDKEMVYRTNPEERGRGVEAVYALTPAKEGE
jgi:predicted ATP-dependent serine protease